MIAIDASVIESRLFWPIETFTCAKPAGRYLPESLGPSILIHLVGASLATGQGQLLLGFPLDGAEVFALDLLQVCKQARMTTGA